MIYRINKMYVWENASALANAEASQSFVHGIEILIASFPCTFISVTKKVLVLWARI
jgi:hypothetical protein